MTGSLIILRPIEGARETAGKAEKMGLSTIVDPLFAVEPIAWDGPPAFEFDALMLTSANAIKYAGRAFEKYKKLPVLAVGKATAGIARQSGLDVAEIGEGGAEDLLRSLPSDRYRKILRLTGKDHVKTPASGREVVLRRVYHARALPLGEQACTALRQGHVVLLYSVRAAKRLIEEMDRLGIDRSANDVAALSSNIAEAAGDGWKTVQVAERPTDDALLSLAGRLCLRSG